LFHCLHFFRGVSLIRLLDICSYCICCCVLHLRGSTVSLSRVPGGSSSLILIIRGGLVRHTLSDIRFAIVYQEL
jgi:hypothetical protein